MTPTLLAFASILLLFAAADEGVPPTLTFDEAVALAEQRVSRSTAVPLRSEIESLRRHRLPTLRTEVGANTSRNLHLFSQEPLELHSATSVLAFDYPLWDGGVTSNRIDALEAKLRRLAAGRRLDDAGFAQLLNVFGELHLVQRQSELLRPLFEELSAEARRSALRISSGEISNLMAAEWREIALSFGSRLLDLEARRMDAAVKLRLLTGLEEEPALLLDLSETAQDVPAGETLRDDRLDAATLAIEQSRARLRDARAFTGLRATLSGFAGLGVAESLFREVTSEGTVGVYGLRVHLTYPLLRGASGIPIAEARADLEHNLAMRDAALEAARTRAAEYRLREQTAGRRIMLLRQSVELARDREQSLVRLAGGGLRSQTDVAQAQMERTRREVDLLSVEIDRWKMRQLLARMTTTGGPQRP